MKATCQLLIRWAKCICILVTWLILLKFLPVATLELKMSSILERMLLSLRSNILICPHFSKQWMVSLPKNILWPCNLKLPHCFNNKHGYLLLELQIWTFSKVPGSSSWSIFLMALRPDSKRVSVLEIICNVKGFRLLLSTVLSEGWTTRQADYTTHLLRRSCEKKCSTNYRRCLATSPKPRTLSSNFSRACTGCVKLHAPSSKNFVMHFSNEVTPNRPMIHVFSWKKGSSA